MTGPGSRFGKASATARTPSPRRPSAATTSPSEISGPGWVAARPSKMSEVRGRSAGAISASSKAVCIEHLRDDADRLGEDEGEERDDRRRPGRQVERDLRDEPFV